MAAKIEKRELFEKTPVAKAIAILAIPSVISQLINLVYNTVDAIFIGRIGNPYMVAAVSVAFTAFMLTVSFANLFGVGGGSLISRLCGRREDAAARAVSAFSFWGALGVSAAYSLLILLLLDPALRFLGASSDTIGFARDYTIYVVVLGSVPIVLSMTMAHLLRSVGYATLASLGLSGGGILNIFLDWLFITKVFPPEQAVKAAAIATLLSNVASCGYLLTATLVLSKKTPLTLSPLPMRRLRGKDLGELFTVGVPSAILTGLFDVGNVFLNRLAAAHDDLVLAAMGIVMKAERLPNAVNIGICQGMLPVVAYNFASGDHDRMRSVMRSARFIGLGVAGLSLVLIELFLRPIVGVFLSTATGSAEDIAETLGYAVIFLGIRCLASPLQFLNYYTSYCMQAMGDGRDTLLHAVIRILLLYVPAMYLLDALFGKYGLACALIVGEGLGAVVATLFMRCWLKNRANKPSP